MLVNNKQEEGPSWFIRLKQFLQLEPKNKEELVSLLREASIRSLIDSETLSMMEGVIQFSQMRVRDIMLPKQQMTYLTEDDAFSQVIHTVTTSGHSRFPVFNAHKDEIIGILHAKDLFHFQVKRSQDFDIKSIVRSASFVPESKRLDLLLKEFRHNRNHMALVVDEYGVIRGFVTIEDIIEQIIGDIEDEFDVDEEAYIKVHGEAQYIIKAHTPIAELNEQLNVNFNDDLYDTVGGIVVAAFGYLPKRGEIITIEPFEFKIINADARGIKLLGCKDNRYKETAEYLEND